MSVGTKKRAKVTAMGAGAAAAAAGAVGGMRAKTRATDLPPEFPTPEELQRMMESSTFGKEAGVEGVRAKNRAAAFSDTAYGRFGKPFDACAGNRCMHHEDEGKVSAAVADAEMAVGRLEVERREFNEKAISGPSSTAFTVSDRALALVLSFMEERDAWQARLRAVASKAKDERWHKFTKELSGQLLPLVPVLLEALSNRKEEMKSQRLPSEPSAGTGEQGAQAPAASSAEGGCAGSAGCGNGPCGKGQCGSGDGVGSGEASADVGEADYAAALVEDMRVVISDYDEFATSLTETQRKKLNKILTPKQRKLWEGLDSARCFVRGR